MAHNNPTKPQQASDQSPAPHWHLGRTPMEAQLAYLEFGLVSVQAAFERYVTQITRLIGKPELSFAETVVIHVVRMHNRAKDAATIARHINRDDLPNIQYTLRKLTSLGLIEKTKSGTSATYQTTAAGDAWTDRFATLRAQLLLDLISTDETTPESLAAATRRLNVLTGLYDSAARNACILDPGSKPPLHPQP